MFVEGLKKLAQKAAGRLDRLTVYWPFRKKDGWKWTQTQGLSQFSQKTPRPYREGLHTGNDFANKGQAPIVEAPINGLVTCSQDFGPRDKGKVIVIHDEEHGISVECCHLASFIVYRGQKVKRGDPLGIEGNTGFSTSKHTHFEWIIDPTNQFIQDRLLYLDGFDYSEEDRARAKAYP